MRERLKFFGIHIDSFLMSDLDKIQKGDVITTLNMDHLQECQKSLDFTSDLKKSDWIIADGISIMLLLRNVYKGSDLNSRFAKIPGIDLAKKLIDKSNRVAFLGSSEKNIEKIKEKFSDKVVFAHHGYFLEAQEEKIFQEIKISKPDLLLVALGSPKQEKIIAKYSKTLENTIQIGVGGAFDIWSEELKRAPKIFQNLNLEWLFRIFQEPSRIFRLYSNVHLFVSFYLSSLFDEG